MTIMARPVFAALAAGGALLAVAAESQARELSAMVVLGEDGAAQARVIIERVVLPLAETCADVGAQEVARDAPGQERGIRRCRQSDRS